MNDIAPELLEKMQSAFKDNLDSNLKIRELYELVRGGKATYIDAEDFAYEVGSVLAKVFGENLSSAILPDGKMYYNIAERLLRPLLEENHSLVADVAARVQEALNQKAGIGIKAQSIPVNDDRIDGIINKVSSAEKYDDVAWVLDEPVKAFSQSVVDESLKANINFQGKAGLHPRVIRKAEHKCCEWCSRLEGEYDYPDVPHDVYRRHERCKCTVDYYPGDGRRQNVHTKQWKTVEERDKIETRKKVGTGSRDIESPADKEKRVKQENRLGLADKIADHPKMLQAYTPKGLKTSLERDGYEVKPLGRGALRGVSFEDGGGFKVNHGGDAILQFHPEEGSHHGGAYYKISSGKIGIKWYDLEGDELDVKETARTGKQVKKQI